MSQNYFLPNVLSQQGTPALLVVSPSVSVTGATNPLSEAGLGSGHSFHRAGAAHPHLPHRVRAPPHLEFGRSPSGCGENFNLLSI